MKIEYTDHAEENLEERKIPKSLVESALENPDKTLEARSRRKIAQKIINNKLIRVIYEEQQGIYRVITVYYTGAGRYSD